MKQISGLPVTVRVYSQLSAKNVTQKSLVTITRYNYKLSEKQLPRIMTYLVLYYIAFKKISTGR